MNRHFCASVFIIDPHTKKILLVKHKKFKKWVQPGGHIEHNGTAEEAAQREVYEERGLKVKLSDVSFPRENDFIRPLAIQCNRNLEGQMHIDITYPAIPINDEEPKMDKEESLNIKWYTREELDKINVFEDVKISMDYILNKYFQ